MWYLRWLRCDYIGVVSGLPAEVCVVVCHVSVIVVFVVVAIGVLAWVVHALHHFVDVAAASAGVVAWLQLVFFLFLRLLVVSPYYIF